MWHGTLAGSRGTCAIIRQRGPRRCRATRPLLRVHGATRRRCVTRRRRAHGCDALQLFSTLQACEASSVSRIAISSRGPHMGKDAEPAGKAGAKGADGKAGKDGKDAKPKAAPPPSPGAGVANCDTPASHHGRLPCISARGNPRAPHKVAREHTPLPRSLPARWWGRAHRHGGHHAPTALLAA